MLESKLIRAAQIEIMESACRISDIRINGESGVVDRVIDPSGKRKAMTASTKDKISSS